MGKSLLLGLSIIGCIAVVGSVNAAPYLPNDDSEVIERLPSSAWGSRRAEWRALRSRQAQRPGDPHIAVELATQYLERAHRDGDPRLVSYAQAALSTWWAQEDPPTPVRVLRAVIRQRLHDFDAALVDLDQVLAKQPDHVQARLTRANVLLVRGEFEHAKRDCLALLPFSSAFVAYTCVGAVTGLTGQADSSYKLLEGLLRREADAPSELRVWALGILAEIAERRADTHNAERHYRAALALDADDPYLLAAYADFLLDQQRAADVIALLSARTQIDALLLRLAIAERASGHPAYEPHRTQLRARFAAAAARGDDMHRREAARFQLALEDRPGPALRLAQANWDAQREPADARLVLEAALASRAPYAARPVEIWLDRHRIEDKRLSELRARLAGAA